MAQASNRQALLEGALLCIEDRGYADVTTRDIAEAANANVSSIAYHFGSKDALIAEALSEGFRRWLAGFMAEAGQAPAEDLKLRLSNALQTLEERLERQRGLANAFVSALSHSIHHDGLRQVLAESFNEMRVGLSTFLNLDEDGFGELRASLLIAAFDGLLIQWLIDPEQKGVALRRLPELLDTVPDDLFSR